MIVIVNDGTATDGDVGRWSFYWTLFSEQLDNTVDDDAAADDNTVDDNDFG